MGSILPRDRIVMNMAETRVIRNPLSFVAKAAQCPNCFSFNSPEYLPEKKREIVDEALRLTCATCGTPYAMAQAA
jgi:hypothetical protein